MRNIALLEWGPASLFYIQPRERIKLRTVWLDGGPIMPPFLSTMEDAKAYASDLHVRYALSAFEDLNGTIKNLRRCFGFPYQEYIGYINTLTRKHRARREHEMLVDRLRRWAIFGNVDAVVWIDYAKANQPPGSFKMGPRDSRPFSSAHIEICNKIESGMGYEQNDGEESEAAWSDLEEEPAGVAGAGAAAATGAAAAPAGAGPAAAVELPRRVPKAVPLISRNGCLTVRSPPRSGGSEQQHSVAFTGAAPKSPVIDGPLSARTLRSEDSTQMSRMALQGAQRLSAIEDSSLGTPRAARGGSTSRACSGAPPGARDEHALLRTMIQEEVRPAHGSIYKRSITPGPGYYGTRADPVGVPRGREGSFGHRPPGRIDEIQHFMKALPSPGDYQAKAAMCETKAPLGCFGRAEKLPNPAEATKKLPFISSFASACEAYGVHSPPTFHTVVPDWGDPSPLPKYSFGKARRPF